MTSEEKELPSFSEYDPFQLPWTSTAIVDVFKKFDYSKGIHEVLCSGTVGSGKSLFGAHVGIKLATQDPKTRCLIGRITLPDAKDTIVSTFADHMEGDFVDGQDYEFNEVKQKWTFSWGAEIMTRSWHKKKWKSFKIT